jgi:UDP-N-acetylmuramoylalanine--D-glutamate ligase
MNLAGKHALILGLGETGLAMARWLVRAGARVTVADTRLAPPAAEQIGRELPVVDCVFGRFPDALPPGFDLVAVSPGVPASETPLVATAKAAGVPVVSEIELFAWGVAAEQPEAKVLAITGSNGKTTTTALTAALLRSVGVDAMAAGNISPSALDALMDVLDSGQTPAVWALELSSFQLEATVSLAPTGATVLNVSEDHLDRYPGMDAYAAAKARIFAGGGWQVLNRDDARVSAMALPGRTVRSFGLDAPVGADDYGLADGWIVRGSVRLIEAASLKLIGSHNAVNAMAALSLCESVGADPVALLPALRNFAGLAHRVETVVEADGVRYIDDSKGTNVGATVAALQGLGCPVAIILGGDGKGQDFSPLVAVVREHARMVALIGRDAGRIAKVLQGCGVPLVECADMREAVSACRAAAKPGDAVLLSPACASLDMYRNYKHRAEVFVAAVQDELAVRAVQP